MVHDETSMATGLTTALRSLWTEFKAFALSGNMFDLALGFIIGTAFAKLVDSLASDVIMQGVAAAFGKPDFRNLAVGPVRYGAFLTELLNFLLLAAVLFMFVKLMGKIGLGTLTGRGGTRATRNCTHCKERVSVRALKCKWCGTDLDPVMIDVGDEHIITARKNSHKPDAQPAKAGAHTHNTPSGQRPAEADEPSP
jgi:large conductance mechanosensitive channel